MCKGSQKTTSTSTSSPDPQAYKLYSNLLSQAQGVAGTPYTPYTGELVPGINPQQNLGIAGINSSAGFAVPYIQQALQQVSGASQPLTAGDIQQYMDPWQNMVTNATINQMTNLNNQQLAQIRGSAAAQGALGGNREAVAEAQTAGQQTAAEAPIIAGIQSQGYQNAINTAMQQKQLGISGAYGLGSLGTAGQSAGLTGANAQIGAGTLEQQTQAAQDAAKYQQFLQALAYPFQTTQWLAGVGTGVGSQMGGSSSGTTTGPAPSPFSQILGGGLGLTSMLGMTGAFGSAGWMAPMLMGLARGGRVKGYADGGVAGDPDLDLAESPDTLDLQQQALVAGQRPAQMFPVDGTELPLPDGMERMETPDGVYHYNPKMISPTDINKMGGAGRQNEFLGLGPFSKDQILKRVQSGEVPVVVVERDRRGTEVRTAIGTMSTAPAQIAAMEKDKMPGSTIQVENPMNVISERAARGNPNTGVIKRQMGGEIPSGVAGTPYSSAQGWIPGIGITRGNPFPPLPKGPSGQQQDPIKEGMQIGNLAKQISGGFSSGSNFASGPAGPDYGGPLNLDNPSYWGAGVEGALPYRRGGTVRGYADGGGPDFNADFDAFNPPAEGVLPANIQGIPTAAMGQTEGFTPTPVSAEVIPPDQVPLPQARPDVPAPTPEPTGVAGSETYAYEPPTPSRQSVAQDAIYYANQYGVPPELYLKVLHQESGLNPNVQPSSAGAIGPAQLMPGTAKDLGVNPYKTSENLKGGAQYLRQMYDKFGNWNDAVRAYNAGPDRVGNWLAGKGGLPAETVAYHRNIMGGGAMPGAGIGVAGMPPGTSPTDMATQRGVAPEDRFGANSNLWPALAAAGFGMMASQSPFPGVAIGQGALTGMQTAASLQKAQQEQALKRTEVNLKVQQLAQEADRWQRDYALKMLPYQGGLTGKEQADLRYKAADLAERTRQHDLSLKTPVRYGQDARGNDLYALPRPGPNGVDFFPIDRQGNVSPTPLTPNPLKAGQPPGVSPQPGGTTPAVMNVADDEQQAIQSAPPPEVRASMPPGSKDARNDAYLQYLAKDDPKYATTLKAVASYQLNPSQLFSLRRNRREQAMGDLLIYDPTYDQRRYNQTNRAITGWAQSPEGRTTRSMSVIIEHLGTAEELGQALQNGNMQALNQMRNFIKTQFGYEGPPNFEFAKQIVADEIAKGVIGGQNAEADRAALAGQLKAASSPEQLAGVIRTAKELMGGQLVGLQHTYETAIGLHNFNDWMTPRANLEVSKILADRQAKLGQQTLPGAPGTAPAPTAKTMTPQDQQALNWANANPNDPRAAAIKKRLGVP